MSEVSIKFLMTTKVAFTEKRGLREEVGKIVEQLSQSLKEKKVKVSGSAVGLLHDDPKSVDPQKAHCEVCLPISGKIKEGGEIKSKDLEKGAFACITHTGPLEKLPQAYNALLKWIEENGYQIAGPTREIYHKGIGATEVSPQEVLVELQFPVTKRTV